MAPAVATYEPQDPSSTVLYNVIAEHLETFLASLDDNPGAKGFPAYVQRAFYDYVQCGILAHGFLRLGCDACPKETLLACSCKRRGFCPSCVGRRGPDRGSLGGVWHSLGADTAVGGVRTDSVALLDRTIA